MSDPGPERETARRENSSAVARLLSGACLLALAGTGFSLLHFLWPTPLAFALFVLLGQGAYGLAILLYFLAIVKDLRRHKVL